MYRTLCNPSKLLRSLLLMALCSCSLASVNQAEIPVDYFTPREVLTHFSADDQIKESVFVVTNPYRAPDWVLAVRSLINRDFWQEREAKGAKKVSFKEPLLVRSVVYLDEVARAEMEPIVEANARAQIEQDLKHLKMKMTRLESDKDTLSPKAYEARKREINDEYEHGSKEALYKKNLKSLWAFAESDYADYYLLPAFYDSDFKGYIDVRAPKIYGMERHFSGFRVPLSYPLRVSASEAREIVATTATPVLADLGEMLRVKTGENLFWLIDGKAVGAMTGALYNVVNAQGEIVNPFQVKAEVHQGDTWLGGAAWFRMTMPIKLEPVQAARHEWDSSLRPIIFESSPSPFLSISVFFVISTLLILFFV